MTPGSDARNRLHDLRSADAAAEPRILSLAAAGATPLHTVLESIVADVRGRSGPTAGQVHVTLDVPLAQRVDVDPSAFRGLVEAIVAAAFAAAVRPAAASDAPLHRELVVTSVDAADAFELEVADSGGRTAGDGAALTAIRGLAARCGGEVVVAACPEGGTAVTIRLRRRQESRMAA